MTQPNEGAPPVEARTDSSTKTGESDARDPVVVVMPPGVQRLIKAVMLGLLALILIVAWRGLSRSYLVASPATAAIRPQIGATYEIHAAGICLLSTCFAECHDPEGRSVLVTGENETTNPIAVVYTFGEAPPVFCEAPQ